MENTIFTVTGMENKKYFQLKNSHKSDMKRTRLFYIVFINFCLSHFLCNLKEYIRYAHIYKLNKKYNVMTIWFLYESLMVGKCLKSSTVHFYVLGLLRLDLLLKSHFEESWCFSISINTSSTKIHLLYSHISISNHYMM